MDSLPIHSSLLYGVIGVHSKGLRGVVFMCKMITFLTG
jgi:hypothetical protein